MHTFGLNLHICAEHLLCSCSHSHFGLICMLLRLCVRCVYWSQCQQLILYSHNNVCHTVSHSYLSHTGRQASGRTRTQTQNIWILSMCIFCYTTLTPCVVSFRVLRLLLLCLVFSCSQFSLFLFIVCSISTRDHSLKTVVSARFLLLFW